MPKQYEKANIRLISGPHHGQNIMVMDFTIQSAIYLPIQLGVVIYVGLIPVKGQCQYILLDDWPLRYIFKGIIKNVKEGEFHAF